MDDAKWETIRNRYEANVGEPLTEDEQRVLRLTFDGNNLQDASNALGMPVEAVVECVESFFVKLQRALTHPPDPDPSPLLPPAAAAALAVPMSPDIPRHIGRLLP